MLSKKNLKNYSQALDKRAVRMKKLIEDRTLIVACEGDDKLLIVKLVNSERDVKDYDTIFFCTKTDYIRRDFDGKYRNGALDGLYEINKVFIRRWGTPYVFASDKDKTLMEKVLKKWHPLSLTTPIKTTPMNLFNIYQSNIKNNRYNDKIKDEIAAIDGKMMLVKKPSAAFERFAHKESFRENYLFYSGDKAYCIYCEKEVTLTEKPKHNKDTKCPACKRKSMYKNLKLGRGCINDRATAVKIENTDNGGLLIRHFTLWRDFKADYKKPDISFHEKVREYVYKYKSQTYEMERFHGFGEYRWCRVDRNAKSSMYSAKLYKRGLRETLNKSDFKYCQLLELNSIIEENSAKRDNGWMYTWYYDTYRQAPVIESLSKAGFTAVLKEMLRFEYQTSSFRRSIKGHKNLIEALGLNKKQYNFIYPIREVVSISFIEFVRDLNTDKLPVYDLETYKKLFGVVKTGSLRDLVEVLQHMTPNKLIKYLRQTDADGQSRRISIYRDYLDFAKKLNWDMKSSFVLYPKNLKESHDIAMNLVKIEKSKSEIERVNKLLPAMHSMYDFKSKKLNLCVIAPNDGSEVIKEGQKLHHCVGTYLNRIGMDANDSIILFVRNMDELDKPYYTMEIRNGKITQLYGMKNCVANDEVKKLKKEYEENVLNKLLAMAG